MEYDFGDPITNLAASNDNPIKHGYFVKYVYRDRRVNPGMFVQYYANRSFHETDPSNTKPNLSERSLGELQVENKRLREALQQIAKGDGTYGAQAFEYKQIARKALGDTNDK